MGQLVKSPDLQAMDSLDWCFESHCRQFVFLNRPLASLSLQNTKVASEHHGKNNGNPNQ